MKWHLDWEWLDYCPARRAKLAKKRKFKWLTDDSVELDPKKMVSSHIFNCIKMMYNNTVPPALRVGQFIRRDIGRITKCPEYMERAVFELTRELMSRPDYDLYEGLLDDMEFNLELWLRLKQKRILMIQLP